MPDIYIASQKKRIKSESKKILDKIGEKTSSNPLAAFAALPEGVAFETQEADEQIVVLLRKHWVTNLSWIFLVILMIIAPLTLKIVPLLAFLPDRFQLMAVIMWYIIILSFAFEGFLSWFFNIYIITDERVIDVDFVSLTYREITDATIDKIQDVTYRTGGLLKAIFDYGDVYIQTAGTKARIEFEDVPKPATVAKIINELIIQEQQEKIEGRVR